jgi:DNA polymerase I-like protein with 3'-5' exonuclease and polymerase domains
MNKIIYAVDFETYYDKECSIRTLGPLGYFSHPKFDAYMVSVVGSDGLTFVGHPEKFDWSLLNDNIVLSHNASFDETLHLYAVSMGWWDSCSPAEWHCTADLVAYCKLPRSLKGATAKLYDIQVDKSTRDNMSGKNWSEMSEEFQKEVSEYAIKDSELCLRLWNSLEDKWPQFERSVSRLNRTIVQRGIPIDLDLLKTQLETIKVRLFEAEEDIPWLGEKPLLSRAAFNSQCLLVGIEPPASLAQTDKDSQEWVEYHSKEHKWVSAVKDWRRINSLKKKLEAFDNATMSDSRYYGGCMYFGAHTGRFSGSGGNLNLQNLPREEMFGVNLRHLINPHKLKRLVVVDLSQIEVRTLCWLANDKEMLNEIAECDDIYEAFAIRFGMWNPDEEDKSFKEHPKLRHSVKGMVLGCGYGAGAGRFASMSNISEKEAEKRVRKYRSKMQRVKTLWSKYNSEIEGSHEASQQIPTEFTVELPSGRVINYGVLTATPDCGRLHFIAGIPRHGKVLPVRLWGGLVAENASQALARDIFSDMMLRVEEAGYKIVMHVHDEMVIEAREEDAEDTLKEVTRIMSEPPAWIPDIPLSAEGSILTRYEK